MYTITEALRELNENFNKADEHYYFNPDSITLNYFRGQPEEEIKTIHGHCISFLDFNKNYNNPEMREKMSIFPLYVGLSRNDYIQAAQELANEPAANYTDNSRHTGVEAFVGNRNSSKNTDINDYIYKIRWKSKYCNAQKLNIIPGFFDIYNELYDNPSGEYADIVIYKDNLREAGNPEILTFYCASKDRLLADAENWKRYEDSDSVSDENLIDAKLIVIENKDVKGNAYTALKNPVSWNSVPNVIVVHPTSVTNRKTDHGKNDGAFDDYFKYNKGYFYDKRSGDARIEINVDKDRGRKDANRGSKVLGDARKVFEKAFWRNYAKLRGFDYRESEIVGMPCFWANDIREAQAKLRNDPKIRAILYRWGLSELEDSVTYDNIINKMATQILQDWDK